MRSKSLGLALSALFASVSTAIGQPVRATEWSPVADAIGRSGTLQADGVMKFGFPRTDLDVRLDDVKVRPALALGSWVAFKRTTGARAMAMGDLVLIDAEIQPVITALEENGVRPTAVHNHLLGESPRITYVHVEAAGDAVKIGSAIRAALALTGTPGASPPAAGIAPPLDLDTAVIHRTLGHEGKVNGGVYQVSVPRREPIRLHGIVVPPSMGVSTAINFQPTGGGRAAITGDFVMRSDEVGRIIPILRGSGIAVTALHSHMIGEEPRLYFMHFWANDDAARLGAALRRALDQMK